MTALYDAVLSTDKLTLTNMADPRETEIDSWGRWRHYHATAQPRLGQNSSKKTETLREDVIWSRMQGAEFTHRGAEVQVTWHQCRSLTPTPVLQLCLSVRRPLHQTGIANFQREHSLSGNTSSSVSQEGHPAMHFCFKNWPHRVQLTKCETDLSDWDGNVGFGIFALHFQTHGWWVVQFQLILQWVLSSGVLNDTFWGKRNKSGEQNISCWLYQLKRYQILTNDVHNCHFPRGWGVKGFQEIVVEVQVDRILWHGGSFSHESNHLREVFMLEERSRMVLMSPDEKAKGGEKTHHMQWNTVDLALAHDLEVHEMSKVTSGRGCSLNDANIRFDWFWKDWIDNGCRTAQDPEERTDEKSSSCRKCSSWQGSKPW